MFKRIQIAGVCSVLLFVFSCKKDNTTRTPVQYHADGEFSQILKSDIPSAVNVVIIGDGYRNEELVSNGEFDLAANRVSNYLFSTPPFSTYKSYFNVYKVYAESAGINEGADETATTKFNAYNAAFNNSGNIRLIKDYAKKAVPSGAISIIILLANIDVPANNGNGIISMITSASGSLPLLLHRLGHNFASLGDEYISPETYATANKSMLATYPNLDVSADPTKVKWSSYLKNSSYKSTIGVYEGGFYVAKGVYRPEGNSVMLNTAVCTSYNAPSREAIARLIFQITGIPFNQADFLEKDKSAIQPRMVSTSVVFDPSAERIPGIRD